MTFQRTDTAKQQGSIQMAVNREAARRGVRVGAGEEGGMGREGFLGFRFLYADVRGSVRKKHMKRAKLCGKVSQEKRRHFRCSGQQLAGNVAVGRESWSPGPLGHDLIKLIC